MKVICILQARLGSKRLPGKVLKLINNQPLLFWSLERLKKSKYINKIIVATSNKKTDDKIDDWISLHKDIDCFRGSEENVLNRYFECASNYDCDLVVRATGDNPLVDPFLIDMSILNFYIDPRIDYFAPRISPSFPVGADAEVLSYKTLKKINNTKMSTFYKEHVTSYILANPKLFKIKGLKYKENLSNWRWTVDYEQDLVFMNKLFSEYPSIVNANLNEIISFLKKRKDILKINSGIDHDFKKI